MAPGKEVLIQTEKIITEKTGEQAVIENTIPLGGGCINDAWKVESNCGSWFLKVNDDSFAGMFEAEMKGLKELRKAGTVLVPEPVGTGRTTDGKILLVMEYIETGIQSGDYWPEFGRNLARLHQQHRDRFGWDHDNYIGSLPQSNREHHIWHEFFISERLEPQVKRAKDDGKISSAIVKRFENMYPHLESIFPNESPALLHGDLWGGNVMTGPAGEPCIFDPAVYYGNREVDLAFSQLFGSFPVSFYDAYHDEWPLQENFNSRKPLYNLYPALVHVNLFGQTYLSMTDDFLKKLNF